MKFMKLHIYLSYFLLIFNIINCQLPRQPIFKCIYDSEKKQSFPSRLVKQKESVKRRIDNEDTPEFVDFHIYLDFKNLEKDLKKNNVFDKKDFYESAMKYVVKTLESLLKVKPLETPNNQGYNLNDGDLQQINITEWDTDKFGDDAINKGKTFQNQNINLAIFGTLTDLPEHTLATASAKYHQQSNGQPYVGVVKINKNIDYSKNNSQIYFESILIHEFTHILGFSKDFFENRYHNLVSKTDKYGVNRYYLNSSKVVEVAKKYFNCDKIDGVELEDQGGTGTAGSHWEARILLGEYMNGYAYTEEQVISEFTLAVLEDSGYYKANYYTGGLMRYGKNKGCEFLEEKCVDSKTHKINPLFENEFYDTISNGNIIDSSCSSGRQSRTYNAWWMQPGLKKEYQYFENPNITGYEPADFCPVPLKYKDEEDQSYFVGHCSQIGSGIYGSMLSYAQNMGSSSKAVQGFTGETFGNNSYCYLSSLSKNQIISSQVRASCYETFCSDRSLTIKIFDDYFVCPRGGGKITVQGYEGYFLCPDYNLVCSGTVVCNNLFDCTEKKSTIKESSYNYDYTIKTSQNIEKANKQEEDDQDNYELSDNGKCPKYCKHCLPNNECRNCTSEYGKKLEEDNSITCQKLTDLKEGYFKNKADVYIKCMDNCKSCENLKSCLKCDEGFFYHQKQCKKLTDEIKKKFIPNCLELDDDYNCIKCNEEFAFNQTNRSECFNISENFKNYYSKDKDVSYYPCDSKIGNCSECYYNKTSFRIKCNLCMDGFLLIDKGNGLCKTEKEVQEDEKYYVINDTHADSCSNAIENCISCNNSEICNTCKYTYVYDNVRNRCLSKNQPNYEQNGNDTSIIEVQQSGGKGSTTSTSDRRKKVKKKKNGSNYFSISNIMMIGTIYIIFLLIKF